MNDSRLNRRSQFRRIMGRRKTSAVWRYFTDEKENGRAIWRCILCKVKGNYCGNTSNLWSHLEYTRDKQHAKAYEEIKDSRQPPRKKRKTSKTRQARLLDDETFESGDSDLSETDEEGSSSLHSNKTSVASSSRPGIIILYLNSLIY